MRISVAARKVEFDAKGYMVETRHALQESFYRAGQAFVETAAPNVPVDTGMARGSFLNLSQLLERKGYAPSTDIPTTVQRTTLSGRALKYTHSDGRPFPKGPGSAKKLSTLGSQAFKFVRGQFTFEYATEVVHFNIHDPNNWMSFKKGLVAFEQVLRETKPPQIKDYITITDIRV